MANITITDLQNAVKLIARHMTEKHDELNALDGRLGDGDIGITMKSGFESALDNCQEWPSDWGKALLAFAQSFVKTRASSYGTLIASGLMSAGMAAKGKTVIEINEIPALLKAAGEGMARRGKSEPGQKTVLDAVEAAFQAAQSYEGTSNAELIEAIHKNVKAAVDSYAQKPNLQGRARMFGDKSIGIPDPGMVAFCEMVAALDTDKNDQGS